VIVNHSRPSASTRAITGKRYSDHLSDAGFDVPPPRTGRG
jgi:hypothetical protein